MLEAIEEEEEEEAEESAPAGGGRASVESTGSLPSSPLGARPSEVDTLESNISRMLSVKDANPGAAAAVAATPAQTMHTTTPLSTIVEEFDDDHVWKSRPGNEPNV